MSSTPRGRQARRFHLELLKAPIKPSVRLRLLLTLVRLYGRTEVLAAIDRALEHHTHDAAHVDSILLQERHRRQLPAPPPLRPQRQDQIKDIDVEEPNRGRYDQLLDRSEGGSHAPP